MILREFKPEDAREIFELNKDTEVIKYTGDPAFESVEEAEKFLRAYDQYKKYKMGRWAVIEKDSGCFLGWCGLRYDPEAKEANLGFRLFQKFWNQGFATEAARASLKYGFEKLGLKYIIGRSVEDNKASVKVLEKLGMRFLTSFDFEGSPGVIYKILVEEYAG